MPHVGTGLPADLAARLNPTALSLADTDWHLPRVYDVVREMGATLLVAMQSRYVIDLNRPPDLNFGAVDGHSCDPAWTEAILAPVRAQSDDSWVLNGRYKGGQINRSNGLGAGGVPAMQLEKAQDIDMDESASFALLEDRVARLRPLLKHCLQAATDWAEAVSVAYFPLRAPGFGR